MVSFTVTVDETAGSMLQVQTAYGKFIDGLDPHGTPVQVCQYGTEFEARVAERMLIGAMQAVPLKTSMLINRRGGRLDLHNTPED
jgi:hypothetical protein